MPRRTEWLAVGSLLGIGLGLMQTSPPTKAQQAAAKTTTKVAAASVDPAPSITSCFPPGATVGKETECTLTGKNLDKINRWIVSGNGVELAEPTVDGNNLKVLVQVAADAEPGVRELRGAGPDGISNVILLRLDTLPQTTEEEPNDAPDKANVIVTGSVVVGHLKPQDVDYYRVEGQKGQRVVLDLEAQRLGTSLSPVLTVMNIKGTALAQARENPGAGHDCRLAFQFPSDGVYAVEVRDNTYSGSDASTYRLRVDGAHFATGLFPLGGPKGQTITVIASGGDLTEPLSKSVTLPNDPGVIVEPGIFEGPGGPVLSPGRLIVSEGPEVNEAAPGADGQSTTPLAIGTIANGRIERPGEVDRYAVAVRKGEKIHVRIQAAPLGSWLDSVLTLRDDKGTMLAENDDPGNNNNQRRAGIVLGLAETPPDSRLDFDPKADGTITIEVSDRYGDGGPEYAYRLDVGAAYPDFSITLLLVNPNVNRAILVNGRANVPTAPGATGAFNLKPGARLPVNFLITPEGFAGSIEVRAEGLPPGVTAASVPIRIAGGTRTSQPSGGFVELKADSDAEPVVGDLKIVATGKTAKDEVVTRTATAMISFNAPPNAARQAFGGGPRPITRTLTHLPVAVIEGPRTAAPKTAKTAPVKKKSSGVVALKDIANPPPLLQGGVVKLALEFDPPDPDPESFHFEAAVKGKGLLTQTIIADAATTITGGGAAEDDEVQEPASMVRIQAAVDAELGARPLVLTLEPKQGKIVVKELVLEVRPPVHVMVGVTDAIRLEPGGKAVLPVTIKREAGYTGDVGLKLEGLPKGVKAGGSLLIPNEQTKLDVPLEMDATAEPLAKPASFRVIGMARMPRGPVRVDSANRPMVISHSAEK
ncbi:MAG TPA: PPC domain-containing protein [Isosphaeraceae bacterium]|nr:PPC domain-containing protein [Isosphaeraceae bacterium]